MRPGIVQRRARQPGHRHEQQSEDYRDVSTPVETEQVAIGAIVAMNVGHLHQGMHIRQPTIKDTHASIHRTDL
jgi:hypothetical protein